MGDFMGWFSSKPKVKKIKLKSGIITKDPFKENLLYVSKKDISFDRSAGFFSPYNCNFKIKIIYEKAINQEPYWGIEVNTYRKLSSANSDKMEKMIEEEPMWREMDDFIVMASGKRLVSDSLRFESNKKATDKTREAWSGGLVKFSQENFISIVEDNNLSMRYYGLCNNSQFDLEDNEVSKIKQICILAFNDYRSIAELERD